VETIDLGINGLDDIEEIGRGGSSRVYRAKQVELDRYVALKVLNARGDANVTRRFDRERKAMGRLSHNEGIVPVYSSGLTEHGEPYLIMPYYPDGSLQDRLERGPLPWQEAVDFVAAAANTMAAAHDAGVVHLDLKPANIMLAAGAPRIADFGIAKLISEQTAPNTNDSQFTPSYSAPETLLEGTATPASDVYGLAATLWALIAGRSPFRSLEGDNSVMAVVGRAVHSPVEDLRHLAPDPICIVIEHGMSKQPTDRYASAGAFADALATAVDLAGGQTGPATVALSTIAPPTHREPLADHVDDNRLILGDAVRPKLVPAEPVGPSTFDDLLDRLPLAGIAVVTVVVAIGVFFLGYQLLTASASDGSANPSGPVTVADSSPTTADGSQVGATNITEPSSTEPDETSPAAESSTTTTKDPGSTSSQTTTTTTTSTSSTSDPTPSSEPTTSSSSTSSTDSTSTPSTAPEPLDPPTSVEARLSLGKVTITWDPPAGQSPVDYTIFRDDVSIGTATGTSFIDENPGLVPLYGRRTSPVPAKPSSCSRMRASASRRPACGRST
jgi:serine/threonine protein kinase